jgi:hypothetical protein
MPSWNTNGEYLQSVIDHFYLTVNQLHSIPSFFQYGFAPKGSSVVVYRNKDYRRFQYFMAPDWQGGLYATATFAGTVLLLLSLLLEISTRGHEYEKGYRIKNMVTLFRRQFPGKQQC